VLVVLWDTTELEEERARAERASYEAWALQRITDPLLVEGGSEPFLQTLVDKVREVMKAHAGSIFLLEPGGQGLVLRTSSGLSLGESKGLRLAMGENLVGRAAAEGRTLWLADAQAVPSVWTSYIRAQNIRGILATPMRVADKLIGVVHVDYQHAHEFSPAEVHLLEVMASRAAIATHQAQLLADNQHQRDRLATLIDTAPVGIVAYGADGRPETVNAAAEIIAGQPPDWGLRIEDEPGHYGIRRKDGSPLPAPEHPAMQAMQGKRCERVPLVIQQRSGRRVHVEVSAAPLRDAASRTVGAVMILEDVSALHDQEHLREEFLIAAAHELKTPLTIAKGCASLLADHVDTGGRTLVERLHRACTRMDHRTDEMLEAVALKSAPHSPPRVDPLR
jgi:K+-sensing histidine kinase KdpD